MNLTVVWYKRDLRITDHAPLYHAAAKGLVLPIYVIEPEYWKQPDTSLRQWQFIKESLLELDTQLSLLGQPLWVNVSSVESALITIREQFGAFRLFSHFEVGNQWTRYRDRRIGKWCQQHDIEWMEFQTGAVIRNLTDRDQWEQGWQDYMGKARLPQPSRLEHVASSPIKPELWPEKVGADKTPCPHRQKGGRKAGLEELSSFLKGRGMHYTKELSNPNTAFTGCSRISPYVTYGVLSQREVVQTSP